MNYIIGLNGKYLFAISDVYGLDVYEEDDVVRMYNKSKKVKFACNKMDMDFLVEWNGDEEILNQLKSLYKLSEKDEEQAGNESEIVEDEPQ